MPGLTKILITAFAQSITSFFYILILMMGYLQIKRRMHLEEIWLGFLRDTVVNQLMYAMLYGMITGLVASTLIVIIGVPLDLNTILVIWPFALILTLFNERYLCFSYAGGIASLLSLIFGWPKIDVSAVIALIGILHMTEGLLIILDGHRYALPVVMEHKRFKPIGAFVMNRLWPVPLVVLTVPAEAISAAGGTIPMPGWWPFFGMQNESGLMLLPLAIMLQYSGLAVTALPRRHTRLTGLLIMLYSFFLLGLAVLSVRFVWMSYTGAIIMPILHETILHFAKKSQLEGNPILGAPWRGLRVLEVLPDYIGSKMGIESGDILLSVNGKSINSEEMLIETLGQAPLYLWMDLDRRGEVITLEYRHYRRGEDKLGIVFVPRKTSRYFQADEQGGLALRLWRRLVQRNNGAQN